MYINLCTCPSGENDYIAAEKRNTINALFQINNDFILLHNYKIKRFHFYPLSNGSH